MNLEMIPNQELFYHYLEIIEYDEKLFKNPILVSYNNKPFIITTINNEKECYLIANETNNEIDCRSSIYNNGNLEAIVVKNWLYFFNFDFFGNGSENACFV